MSRIVRPQGPVVERLTVTVDSNGQTMFTAESLTIDGKAVPMAANKALLILSQLLTAMLARMNGAKGVFDAATKEANSHDGGNIGG